MEEYGYGSGCAEGWGGIEGGGESKPVGDIMGKVGNEV